MLTIGTRFTVSPAQTGVALSYILSIQQVCINASSFCHALSKFYTGIRLDSQAAIGSREQHELC